MTFEEATQYLFSAFPSFEKSGKTGINEGLSITQSLLSKLGNPQDQLKVVHIAGTNGKGSSSHFLASICQEAGYKTGLFTSPHIKSYTERIRVNGIAIPEQAVVDFILEHKELLDQLKPSFFEITTALAYDYFYRSGVEIAIIETGLGGRLDSTNVVKHPLVSFITNVGWDHMDMLGDDIKSIAFEKAGIIKEHTPVVLSEGDEEEYRSVISEVALANHSPMSIASDRWLVTYKETSPEGYAVFECSEQGVDKQTYDSQLLGGYQAKNIAGILEVCSVLERKGFSLKAYIRNGLKKVVSNTGMKGRWQVLSSQPLIVCDAVHNVSGWKQIQEHIAHMFLKCGVMVLGFSSDKKPELFIDTIPINTQLIFSSFNNKRAIKPAILADIALKKGFKAMCVENVNDALAQAKVDLPEGNFIFVGGSIYLLSELNNI